MYLVGGEGEGEACHKPTGILPFHCLCCYQEGHEIPWGYFMSGHKHTTNTVSLVGGEGVGEVCSKPSGILPFHCLCCYQEGHEIPQGYFMSGHKHTTDTQCT